MFGYQFLWAALASLVVAQAWATELQVVNPWVREAPPVAQSHGAYMELVNNSEQAVEIISVLADDYTMTMLHKTVEKNGLATMEHVDRLVIPPHGSVQLQPGALHIMLMNPKRKLKAGDTVKITLCFDRDHHQEVMAIVKAAP